MSLLANALYAYMSGLKVIRVVAHKSTSIGYSVWISSQKDTSDALMRDAIRINKHIASHAVVVRKRCIGVTLCNKKVLPSE